MAVSDRYEQANYERWRKLPLRERYRWRAIFIIVALAALFAVAFYMRHANAAPIDSSNVTVIDGDTIQLNHKRPDVR